MLNDEALSIRSVTPRRRRVGDLQRTNTALALELGKKDQVVGKLLCDVDRERQERLVLRGDLGLQQGKEALMVKEIKALRRSLDDLRTEHKWTLCTVDEQETLITDLQLEVQSLRNKELTRLRDSVCQAARDPVRDRTVPLAKRAVRMRKKTSAQPAAVQGNSDPAKKLVDVQGEVTALKKENQLLTGHNTRYAEELAACHAKNNELMKLLSGVASQQPPPSKEERKKENS